MPMAEALRRCPKAIVVRHHMERYSEASRLFFDILSDFSPLVESLSVDEAFVDVTGVRRLFGDGPTIARAIKDRVQSELGLVASIGIAPTKFVAKIASDIDKPDGLHVVEPGRILEFLHPLPVSRLWGVGKVSQRKLSELGLTTIGHVARYPQRLLEARLGRSHGAHLAALSRGEDLRRVEVGHETISIGHEETFDRDVGSVMELEPRLLSQADRVATRLRRADLRASIVVIKIKYADFRLISRRRTLADPTSDGNVVARVARELLAEIPIDDDHGKSRRVRLCGVAAGGLEKRDAPRQLTLDEQARQRGERLGDTLDEIRGKFGDLSIGRALYAKPSDR
jgi:DNA polymerase-4